jgi:Flp pilus assembly protein protease CpaA
MITDIILVSTGLIWVIAASIFDIKTREVPDWLSFSLIAIGLGIRGIHSLFYWDYNYILYGLIGLILFFIIGNIMYYTKQWGGGDSKLLMGLGAIFGSYTNIDLFNPNLNIPFLLILLVNILIIGAIYGIIYGLILGILNWRKVLPLLKKQNKLILIISIFVSIIIFIIGLFVDNFGVLFIIFSILILLFSFILFFIAAIEKVVMIKRISVGNLREGDWLCKDVVKNNKILCTSKGLGITKEDIKLLKKNKIREVIIKDGLPFVPSFLIGIIISFIFGNLISLGL